MVSPRKVPRNDAEDSSLAYRDREPAFRAIVERYSNQAVKGMISDIRDILNRAGALPSGFLALLAQPADAMSIARLMTLAQEAPARIRKKVNERLFGVINSGSATNRWLIRNMIRLHTYKVIDPMVDRVSRVMVDVAEEGMARGTWMVQASVGAAWTMETVSNKRLKAFADKRFGMEGALSYMRPLEEWARKEVETSLLLGEGVDKMSARLMKSTGMNRKRADRLARTTITQASNDAHMESYRKAGVRQFYLVATFDERTCPVCGARDRVKVPIDQIKRGINYPPLHPNCRCTTLPVVTKEVEAMRAPRTVFDRTTRERHTVPQNYSFREWYVQYGPGRTDGKPYTPAFKRNTR